MVYVSHSEQMLPMCRKSIGAKVAQKIVLCCTDRELWNGCMKNWSYKKGLLKSKHAWRIKNHKQLFVAVFAIRWKMFSQLCGIFIGQLFGKSASYGRFWVFLSTVMRAIGQKRLTMCANNVPLFTLINWWLRNFHTYRTFLVKEDQTFNFEIYNL